MGLTYQTYDAEKLQALKEMRGFTLGEVVALYFGAPDGTKYCGSSALDDLSNFRNILNHTGGKEIDHRLVGSTPFESVVLAADVADERVTLNFTDLDGEITRLFRAHGEGVRVEFFYYFPEIDYFVSHWYGHLRPPTESDIEYFKASAASGFRSTQMNVPRRLHPINCQNLFPPAVPILTQAEIDEGDCPYNRHIGGMVGNLDPDTGLPYPRCRKDLPDCGLRLGDTKSHTGINTKVAAVVIGQSGGHPTTLAVSRGNETNLKQPIRLIYGKRIVRDLKVLAYRQEHNSNHPDQGFLAALMEVCEGTIRSMTSCSVNNSLVGAAHLNVRLGSKRQPATAYAPDISNFNRLAHFFGRIGPLNPGGYSAANITGQCTVEGIADMRVYTTPEEFTLDYSVNNAWCIMDMYANRRYGHGLDRDRFVIQDWIDLAPWSDQVVSYTDPNGKVWTAKRNEFNADLPGKSAQQQFRDACLFSRFTPPFQHLGKLRILPLTAEPLENVPVFTDVGPERNILRDEKTGKPQIWWSQMSDADIANQITFNFEDAANANIQRPLTFLEEDQQRKSGIAFGDNTLRVVEKPYQAICVTNEAQAVRNAWLLYHLGEFDEGGTKNNFKVRMIVKFTAGFELYQSQVVKLDVALIRRASMGLNTDGSDFKYFRVLKKIRQPDLTFEVHLQAYPEHYYGEMDVVVPPAEEEYEAEDPDNTLTGDAEIVEDPACSGGAKVTGIGNGSTLRFNGVTVGATGFYEIHVYYKSNAFRTGFYSINGGAAQPLDFPSGAGSIRVATITRRLEELTSYAITFLNQEGPLPDIDKIVIQHITIDPPDNPTDDPDGPTCSARIGEVTYVGGQLRVPVLPCE